MPSHRFSMPLRNRERRRVQNHASSTHTASAVIRRNDAVEFMPVLQVKLGMGARPPAATSKVDGWPDGCMPSSYLGRSSRLQRRGTARAVRVRAGKGEARTELESGT